MVCLGLSAFIRLPVDAFDDALVVDRRVVPVQVVAYLQIVTAACSHVPHDRGFFLSPDFPGVLV
jgi:hypothetical protein